MSTRELNMYWERLKQQSELDKDLGLIKIEVIVEVTRFPVRRNLRIYASENTTD